MDDLLSGIGGVFAPLARDRRMGPDMAAQMAFQTVFDAGGDAGAVPDAVQGLSMDRSVAIAPGIPAIRAVMQPAMVQGGVDGPGPFDLEASQARGGPTDPIIGPIALGQRMMSAPRDWGAPDPLAPAVTGLSVADVGIAGAPQLAPMPAPGAIDTPDLASARGDASLGGMTAGAAVMDDPAMADPRLTTPPTAETVASQRAAFPVSDAPAAASWPILPGADDPVRDNPFPADPRRDPSAAMRVDADRTDPGAAMPPGRITASVPGAGDPGTVPLAGGGMPGHDLAFVVKDAPASGRGTYPESPGPVIGQLPVPVLPLARPATAGPRDAPGGFAPQGAPAPKLAPQPALTPGVAPALPPREVSQGGVSPAALARIPSGTPPVVALSPLLSPRSIDSMPASAPVPLAEGDALGDPARPLRAPGMLPPPFRPGAEGRAPLPDLPPTGAEVDLAPNDRQLRADRGAGPVIQPVPSPVTTVPMPPAQPMPVNQPAPMVLPGPNAPAMRASNSGEAPEVTAPPPPMAPAPAPVPPLSAAMASPVIVPRATTAPPPMPAQASIGVVGRDTLVEEGLWGPVGASVPPGPTAALDRALPPDLPPQLARQLAQGFAAVSRDPGSMVEIALDPPELGRVRLSFVEVNGVMTLSIMADRPETADLMRRHMAVLTEEFARQGLDGPAVNISGGGDNGGRGARHAPAPMPPLLVDPQNGAPSLAAAPEPLARSGRDQGMDLRL